MRRFSIVHWNFNNEINQCICDIKLETNSDATTIKHQVITNPFVYESQSSDYDFKPNDTTVSFSECISNNTIACPSSIVSLKIETEYLDAFNIYLSNIKAIAIYPDVIDDWMPRMFHSYWLFFIVLLYFSYTLLLERYLKRDTEYKMCKLISNQPEIEEETKDERMDSNLEVFNHEVNVNSVTTCKVADFIETLTFSQSIKFIPSK